MPPSFVELDSREKLDDLFERSHQSPVLIFKHSSSCGVSAMAYRKMNEYEGEINLVVVQDDRDVSNAIEQKTGIRHQSPQAIILKEGRAVYNASHYSINAAEIRSEMSK